MFEGLYQKLAENNLIDENNNIILAHYENGQYQAVDKQTFETFFSDVQDQYSYNQFIGSHTFQWGNPPQSLTYTSEQTGYKPYFDEWKTLDILV